MQCSGHFGIPSDPNEGNSGCKCLIAPSWLTWTLSPGDASICALGQSAARLFAWASTACHFIDGYNPQQHLDVLLQGTPCSKAKSALSTLYWTALQSIDLWDDGEFCADFHLIIETILVAILLPRNPYPTTLLMLCYLWSVRLAILSYDWDVFSVGVTQDQFAFCIHRLQNFFQTICNVGLTPGTSIHFSITEVLPSNALIIWGQSWEGTFVIWNFH